MNKDTLDVLADTISDVGSWRWRLIKDDMSKLKFRDVQLHDVSKFE